MCGVVGTRGVDKTCTSVKLNKYIETKLEKPVQIRPHQYKPKGGTVDPNPNKSEWYVYTRNCGSDDTCCRDWFCVSGDKPLTMTGAVEAMFDKMDVWHEYAFVHEFARPRYEKQDEHICSSS